MSQPSAAEASMEAIQELVDHHRAHARYHAEALAYWENELAKRKAMLPLNDEVMFALRDPCHSMLMMECRDLRTQQMFIWRKPIQPLTRRNPNIMLHTPPILFDRSNPLQAP